MYIVGINSRYALVFITPEPFKCDVQGLPVIIDLVLQSFRCFLGCFVWILSHKHDKIELLIISRIPNIGDTNRSPVE
jgi:hypothetical protein